MGVPRLTAERPEWQELRDRHGQDWIEPTPANLQWLSDQGYAHLAELIALLQAELVVVRERAERLERELKEESEAKWTARKATQEAENEKAELEARLGRAAAERDKAVTYLRRWFTDDSLQNIEAEKMREEILRWLAVLAEQEKEQ